MHSTPASKRPCQLWLIVMCRDVWASSKPAGDSDLLIRQMQKVKPAGALQDQAE